ncbi:MAG: alcohol dehydrogenase, partial [Paenibacillus sp.]|nr:alcohol dehydrogenase [Paenibacillus sp.]
PSMVRSGALDTLQRQLDKRGIGYRCSLEVKPEPTIENLETVYGSHREDGYDVVIALGGGSVLDAAKVLSVLPANDVSIVSMLGVDAIEKPGLPTVLIPSTSGTGSEVTPNAIVTLPEQELKTGIVSRHLLPRLVILDPLLTLTLPPAITAATGMDAFTHAFESFISRKANPISDMYALEAMRLISGNIEIAYNEGKNVQAREAMLLASTYGGMALSSAGTAAVHAMAYPIGAKYNIPHGTANSMLLPHVTSFNLDAIEPRMPKVAAALGFVERAGGSGKAAPYVLGRIDEWTKALRIPQTLEAFGAKRDHIPELAAAAARVTRLMDNNPKPMTIEQIEEVYLCLLA